jgi:ATP-binding cassette subfamily B protein
MADRPFQLARLRNSFTHVPRTLGLVWKSSPRATAGLAALTLASAALPLLIAYAGKAIVDAVVAHDAPQTLHWVLVELGLVAALALVQRGLGLIRQLLGARLALDINVLILEKALTLELRHFEDSEFYDRLTRARREASSRPVSVVTESFQLLQNVLTLIGYIGVLIAFSPLVVVGLILAAIPATVSEMRFSNLAFRMRNWRSPDSRRLMYLEYVLANDNHAKEVKIFGLGPMLLERYRKLGETFFGEDRRIATQRAGWGFVLSLLGTGAFYGAYVAMALAAAHGNLTLGQLTLYVVAFRQGQQAFQSSLSAIGSMYEDNLYMSNLFEYLTIPSADAALLPPGRARHEEGIRFEGVGFRYPSQEKWALRDLNLWIPKGQSLALVGHNGAGKTTFIKLLARLYEPTEGRILLDGRDIRSFERDELHRRLSVVFQDFNEYQFTAKDNVGVGSIPHMGEEPRIDRAIENGGATEVVHTLPKGVETQLGKWFKDGTELSGGQWQKIALARAFMREEADVLVLDEPTAALDAEAEHAVFERFRSLAKGRTTIVISHRFSTVRMADRIIVIEAGRVMEEGTHDQLVAVGGRYAQLFTLQAQGYL